MVLRWDLQRCERSRRQVVRGRRQITCMEARKRHAREQCGATVGHCVASPARVQPTIALRSELGLAIVEVGGAELADAVGHDATPGYFASEIAPRIDRIHDARPGAGHWLRLVEQRAKIDERQRCLAGVERGLEVHVTEPTFAIRLPIPSARHEQLRARQGLQRCGDVGERPFDRPPKRIDGDKAIEWPGRSNARASTLNGVIETQRRRSMRDRPVSYRAHTRASKAAESGICVDADVGCSRGGQMRNVRRVKRSSR